MAISTMYPAMPGSPETVLVGNISAVDTSLVLDDSSVLPTAPNLCVLGNDSTAEVVLYTEISGNQLNGLVRGLGGTVASAWTDGTPVARTFTSFDHDRFILNIEALNTDKAPLESPALTGTPTAPTASTGTSTTQIATTAFVQGEISGKAPIASPTFTGTPAAPTATLGTNTTQLATTAFVQGEISGKAPLASPAFTGNPTATTQSTDNNSTRLATTAFVQKHAPIHLSVTASAGTTVTKSDSRITSTMRVINCVFGTPIYVISNISWQTASGSVTFTGTFSGSTTIDFDLVEVN